MNKEDLVNRAYELFSQFEKPLHSTNYKHCDECLEYDELLKQVRREELAINDVGTVCWGPVPYLLPEARAYYMPRFVELALENVKNKDDNPYITQFINQTGSDPDSDRYSLFSSEHKHLVHQAFEYINENFREIVEDECWENDLDEALSGWRA